MPLNTEHNQVILSWRTPEFIPHPKGKTWYLIAGILVLSLTAYAILTGSATMAIVFLLLGGVYYLTQNQKPKIIEIRLTQLGVQVGSAFYPYSMINSFWVVYDPPFVQRLYLRVGSKSFRHLKIELNDQNPVEVRHLLAKEVPEVEGGEESLTDLFIRLLRLQ